MTNEIASIILEYVRAKRGRLTYISEVTNINRQEFCFEKMVKMKFFRQLRIFFAMSLCLDRDEQKAMWSRMGGVMVDYADKYDESLLTSSAEEVAYENN